MSRQSNWRTITDANGEVILQRKVTATVPMTMTGWETVARGGEAISQVYCAICFSMVEVVPGNPSLCPAHHVVCEPAAAR